MAAVSGITGRDDYRYRSRQLRRCSTHRKCRADGLDEVAVRTNISVEPCSCGQIGATAEQFEQVVAGADQRPLAADLLQSPQKELTEATALLDLAEHRLHSLHPQSVALPTDWILWLKL